MAAENEVVFGVERVTITDRITGVLKFIIEAVASAIITPSTNPVALHTGGGHQIASESGQTSAELKIAFSQASVTAFEAAHDTVEISDNWSALGGYYAGSLVCTETKGAGYYHISTAAGSAADKVAVTTINMLTGETTVKDLLRIHGAGAIVLTPGLTITLTSQGPWRITDKFYILAQDVRVGSNVSGASARLYDTPRELVISMESKRTENAGSRVIIAHRVVPAGFPLGMTSAAFQEHEFTAMLLFDPFAKGYYTQIHRA